MPPCSSVLLLWILAWHVDSWKTRLADNLEIQSELDPSCQRLRDVQTLTWLLYILAWEEASKIRDLDTCCTGCGGSPSEEFLS